MKGFQNFTCAPFALGGGKSSNAILDIVFHSHVGKQTKILENVANSTLGWAYVNVAAGVKEYPITELNRAAVWRNKSRNAVQERRFPGSRGAKDYGDSGCEGELNVQLENGI
ncbi:MAG: hypothetical protein WCA49_12585 [Candidatus Sulfotelmatobacter sp.]